MISVDEARDLVRKNSHQLTPVKTSLRQALAAVLAEDVYAGSDIPAFHQSAMDGYAIAFSSWEKQGQLKIVGEIPAGESSPVSLQSGKAMKIFTGAPVPDGADTVVIREHAEVKDDTLYIQDKNLVRGKNVRSPGSEIKAGSLAAGRGTLLTPAVIGFLAGAGIGEVTIIPMPKVSLIVTGNELQPPGRPLKPGQVYESNSFTIKALLDQLYIPDLTIRHAVDKPGELGNILGNAILNSDLVLLTGGVSAGDYDFVLQAAEQCGIKKIFHKVKQKPGKPLFYGTRDDHRPVFGLPGNPASVLTCFYEYVIPCIEILTGRKSLVQETRAALSKGYKKEPGLTFFLKGYAEGNRVTILDAQESYRMSSYARANCL
ncbi:MAG TPA: gephyrin-like molybdotransferase Glp, partial [Cyclobacteriaceae bacterium]|nr:gephyrin-like molybdotransferase Glp [Cyclobacteriaceae bacterium]